MGSLPAASVTSLLNRCRWVRRRVAQPRFVDADHDGDLDVMVGGRLLRNNGNGRFQDVSAEARLGSTGSAVAIVPVDVDNRRDVDLLVISHVDPPMLFSNQRDGTFRDVAKEIGLPSGGPYTTVAVGDINKDTIPDFFFGRAERPWGVRVRANVAADSRHPTRQQPRLERAPRNLSTTTTTAFRISLR